MPYTPCPKINLLAPGFPLFVPVFRPASKSGWRPWGRSAPPILSFGQPEAESYFQRRNAPARAIDHKPVEHSDHKPSPYPRRGDLLPDNTTGDAV
jgi:hypothetical protein